MPKHIPTFKHLVSNSYSTPKANEKPRKSVNQLIASSRSNEAPPLIRDAPPHPHVAAAPTVWVPGAGDVSVLVACGMAGEAPIHPAELLRRSELARRQAARSVAGPVAPPSWRAAAASSPKPAVSTSDLPQSSQTPVSKHNLIRARALFDHPPRALRSGLGGGSLVEYCLRAVLLHLESTEVIMEDEGEMTIGEAMREQVGYLDPHLKLSLLDLAGIRPDPAARLSDQSIRAILARPDLHSDSELDETTAPSLPEPDDWAAVPVAPPEIHHLPLVLHPNPLPLLRQLPSFSSLSLTSLNLAYSTVKDLERLVTTLPGSLRELGLVGIRFVRQIRGSEEDVWKKGLALLGKKMIVMRMLDLSFPTIPITTAALSALCTPERSQIPSLRVLGLRGIRELELPPIFVGSNRKRWIEVIRDNDPRL